MSDKELHERLGRLYEKLLFSCYGLYDSMNRFGDAFDWMDMCRAYERAISSIWKKLG